MLDIDLIIPCYGKPELINRGLASIATQWKREFIHVTLVNDCSPYTKDNYKELVDRYKNTIDIRCIKTPQNYGQGLARQYGIDHTKHDWIFFMDEDDQLGSGIAASCFCNPIEINGVKRDEHGNIMTNPDGSLIKMNNYQKIGVVTGPLFEFDDNHTHVIPSSNTVWPTAKLYNREFLKKHNIRFNKPQSRHAEDYFFTSCFFYALDHDDEYTGVMLDDQGIYYIWYPNPESQSRKDPHYGHMLAGYTMDGSVNILKYIKNYKKNKLPWNKEIEDEYSKRILNMTVYSWYSFVSFLDHYCKEDFEPIELDWTILRDACSKLREYCLKYWDTYTYYQIFEELYAVKNMSDVQWCNAPNYKPELQFNNYILNGCKYFDWSYEDLKAMKQQEEPEFKKEED